MKDIIYRHYGSNELHEIKPVTFDIKCGPINKPYGGLWVSPIGEQFFTWKELCEDEDYHVDRLNEHFDFKLKDTAKILTIDSPESYKDIIVTPDSYIRGTLFGAHLNYDVIFEKYDGIELIHGEHYNEFHLFGMFNSWDCDSICIWNKDAIELV